MIDIRGAKAQAQESDPAERYVLKDKKKSKTPAVLTMFLLGVALYLKSVFPSRTETEEGKRHADREPEGEAEPGMAQTASLDRPALAPPPVDTANEDELLGSGGGRLTDLLPPAEFMRIEFPEVGYFQPEVAVDWTGFKASPAIWTGAANDNSGGGTVPGGSFPPVPEGPDDRDADPADNGPGDTDPGDTDPGGNGPCGGCPDEKACEADEDPQSGNRAPRVAGPVYLLDVTGCAILAIGLTDLLRNADDPDGDVLSVRNLTVSSGTLTQSDDGWVFQGGPQLLGPVTISYEITDGEFTVAQTAHFSVVKSYIGGTGGDDMLVGTMCSDDIDGGDGDDNIDGRAGNDVIAGGRGNDHVVAGAGNDTVFGGAGNDIVFGGPGNDHISGGAGNDKLFGEKGNDIIFGDAGDDYLSGGDGDDLLSGGEGNDIIFGDAGDDTIDGGEGNDELHGGTGNDVLIDGAGEDVVYGGDGNDYLIAAVDGDDDVYDGGAGHDTIDYSATSQGVTVNLVSGQATGVEIGDDVISGFETAVGGSGHDHFIVGNDPVVLVGGEGDNLFEFAPGDAAPAPVLHEILDFKVGDRIRLDKYDIFERVFDKLEDRFEEIYGDDIDDDDIAIRYRHDRTDEIDRTIVEADFDRDDIYETTITLNGNHILVIVEHA